MEQDLQKEKETLKDLTMQWIDGWKTSPSQPFTIDRVARLYKQDERLSSFDTLGAESDGDS